MSVGKFNFCALTSNTSFFLINSTYIELFVAWKFLTSMNAKMFVKMKRSIKLSHIYNDILLMCCYTPTHPVKYKDHKRVSKRRLPVASPWKNILCFTVQFLQFMKFISYSWTWKSAKIYLFPEEFSINS